MLPSPPIARQQGWPSDAGEAITTPRPSGLVERCLAWLAGAREAALTASEQRATFMLFLIAAFCFNILPPDFFYAGGLEGGAEGSLGKQLFWIAMLLFTLRSLLDATRAAGATYFRALPLLLLGLLLLSSALWSLAPAISLRRAVLEMIVVGSVLVGVASVQRSEQVFVIIYRVATLTLLCEGVMLLRSNGFDEAGFFRGIHTQKNVLGLVAALSLLCGLWIRRSGLLRSSWWNGLYLAGWFGLLLLSRSKTSLALVLAAPLLAMALHWISIGTRSGFGVFAFGAFTAVFGVFSLAYIAGFDLVAAIVDEIMAVGFTGRDDIWQFLVARFLERPWLGYGYGGFWDIGPASPNLRYGTGYIPMINQAHNGYLDLALALGIAGLLAFAGVLAHFLSSLSEAERRQPQLARLCWVLLVFSLLHNFTESTLLRGYALVWVAQLLAMAVVYRLAAETRRPR